MALPVNFDADSAARIYRAVREVERGNRDQRPLTFRTVADAPRGRAVRMATYTGAWALNASQVVTLYQSTSTAATFSVTNVIMPIPEPPPTPEVCVIARDRGAWFLVNVQMSEQSVISGVSLQPNALQFERSKVVSVSGTQTTSAIAITECDNEAASAEQLNWFFG